MARNKAFLIALTCFIAGLIFAPQARAQSGPNFSIGIGGNLNWTQLESLDATCPTDYDCNYSAGGASISTTGTSTQTCGDYIWRLPYPMAVSHVTTTVTYGSVSLATAHSLRLYHWNGGSSYTTLSETYGVISETGSHVLNYDADLSVSGVNAVGFTACLSYANEASSAVWSGTVVTGTVTLGGGGETGGSWGGGTAYKPVAAPQIVAIEDGNTRVVAARDANVYAMGAGTVESATHDTNGWSVVIWPDFTPLDASSFIYYSNMSTAYAKAGDRVAGGCLLGQAAKINFPGFDVSELRIHAPDDVLADWPTYADSTSVTPCNTPASSTPNCLTGNPALHDNGAGWSDSGVGIGRGTNPDGPNGFIQLDPGAYVYQSLNLEADIDYYLMLEARPAASQTGGTYATVSVHLGNVDTTAGVAAPTAPSVDQYTMVNIGPLHPTEPDSAPDVYNLRVTASDPHVGVTLAYICLTTSEIVIPPTSCYFRHADQFDSSTEWTLGGGAEVAAPNFLTPLLGGGVNIPAPDGYISAPIELRGFSDRDANYEIQVTMSPYGADILHILDPTSTATFAVTIQNGETVVASLYEVGSNVIANGSPGAGHWKYDFSVDQGDLKEDTFYFKVTEVTGQTVGLHVSRICISLLNGTHWPGYENSDVQISGSGQTINEFCQDNTPPAPLSVDTVDLGSAADLGELLTGIALGLQIILAGLWNLLSAWIIFLYIGILNLWFCFLAPPINTLINGLGSIYLRIGDVVSWLAGELGAVIGAGLLLLKTIWFAFLASLATLLTFLFGQDIASRIFDWLAMLYQLAGLLFDLLSRLPGFLINLAAWFIVFLLILPIFLSSFPDALNNAPNAVTFTCLDTTGTGGLCDGLALADRMLGGVSVMDILFTVMTGLIVLSLILWTIGQIRDAFNRYTKAN